MLEESRRRLAYAIVRSTGRAGDSVFSHTAGKSVRMSGAGPAYHDHETGSDFSTTYDFQTKSRWRFIVGHGKFEGFAENTSDPFSGKVDGGTVSLFDHGLQEWHKYRVDAASK